MWSQHKHYNTAKYLISITPQGVINFISRGWGGRTSDQFIVVVAVIEQYAHYKSMHLWMIEILPFYCTYNLSLRLFFSLVYGKT